MPDPRRPWILDFDGTITTKDTIETIAKFAISQDESKRDARQKEWDDITRMYMADRNRRERSYIPAKKDRMFLEQEISFQRDLKKIEKASFDRVMKSKIFKGITKDDWEEGGKEAVQDGTVSGRNGIHEFVQAMTESVPPEKLCWGVVSVNFSKHFIGGVLIELGLRKMCAMANISHPDGCLEGPIDLLGEQKPLIVTSEYKLAAMRKMLKFWRQRESMALPAPMPVYIGDSGPDIECLMEDGIVGIVMSENEKSDLMETLARVGCDVRPIEEFREREEKIVYWARDFTVIVKSPLVSEARTEVCLAREVNDQIVARPPSRKVSD